MVLFVITRIHIYSADSLVIVYFRCFLFSLTLLFVYNPLLLYDYSHSRSMRQLPTQLMIHSHSIPILRAPKPLLSQYVHLFCPQTFIHSYCYVCQHNSLVSCVMFPFTASLPSPLFPCPSSPKSRFHHVLLPHFLSPTYLQLMDLLNPLA